MADITLRSSNPVSATSVSNTFIDEYMSDANGEFVKIYLYLLRLMNIPKASFSISSIADKFDHTEKDIRRALCYWERMRLLRLEYDDSHNLTGICLLDSAPQPAAADAAAVSADSSRTVPVPDAKDDPAPDAGSAAPVLRPAAQPARKTYSSDDIRQFQQNESIAELLFIAERYLGRTLNDTDIQTILYLHDGLGFSAELIEYLIESCVNSRHTSIRYIERAALRWADEHITTVEEAKLADNIHSRAYYTVMNSFGISGRKLVPSEIALVKKWSAEYGFSDELIAEACRRTIQAIHEPGFAYADSILENWHRQNVRSQSDLAGLDAEHQKKRKHAAAAPSPAASSRNKFNNFQQRSYDYDKLEKLLLTTTVR
ncbi:MAG: DnaD domain protein [Roseburia sp.]|jgi:DnaD/phage-associated family protein|nr:DnaD domain protein [Roseburia sp.]